MTERPEKKKTGVKEAEEIIQDLPKRYLKD